MLFTFIVAVITSPKLAVVLSSTISIYGVSSAYTKFIDIQDNTNNIVNSNDNILFCFMKKKFPPSIAHVYDHKLLIF